MLKSNDRRSRREGSGNGSSWSSRAAPYECAHIYLVGDGKIRGRGGERDGQIRFFHFTFLVKKKAPNARKKALRQKIFFGEITLFVIGESKREVASVHHCHKADNYKQLQYKQSKATANNWQSKPLGIWLLLRRVRCKKMCITWFLFILCAMWVILSSGNYNFDLHTKIVL